MAAVLAAGPSAVLSHHSAAALWGIRESRRGPIDVTSPSKTKSHGSIRRHEGRLPADEVTVHVGIPVTIVPRTIFDLSASIPQAVEPALRQAEYLRLYDSLSLPDLLERYPGHRGSRAVRAALARLRETPGRTRSRLEERFVAFLDLYALPRPHFNAWITVGSDRFQADCLWPDQRLIVELDSWSAHGTRSAFRSDKTRDRKLAVAGYTTTRIPWAALDDEPAEIAADLRALLGKPKP
jgi:very-short-patch-repair endonuclease